MSHGPNQEVTFEATRREERRALTWRIVRWSIAIPLLLSFPHLGIFSIFLVCFGSILIAPDIATFLGNKFSNFILQSGQKGVRQPAYSIAESKAVTGHFDEAIVEYEKIMEEYPQEAKPHMDLVQMALARMQNKELADTFYQRGMESLTDPSAREVLTHVYERNLTLLKPHEIQPATTVAFKPKNDSSS